MTPSLRDLQQAFVAALYEDDAGVIQHVRDGAFSAPRHMQVYRNNVFTTLTESLATVYPVVRQLVGEEFFTFVADRYIRRYPPMSGYLQDFGSVFADFLAAFEPARSLVYLPDVARVEWASQEAFHAADAEPMALESLAAVAPNDYPDLVFHLPPSARLLASDYPVFRIWCANQSENSNDTTIDLDSGGENLLVQRRGIDVEIEPLSAGDYALLNAFVELEPFSIASAAALSMEADFDLTRALQHHVASETLVGFHLNHREKG